ncbi:hypothetical protein ABEF95_002510 [Exophiala dermatitidis]
MFLSSRANPPKPLRLGGGGSSERYLSIKSLLPSTPIPSPSLPSILPRHGKKPPKLNSRRIVRGLLWLSLLIGVYYLARSSNGPKPGSIGLSSSISRTRVHEIVDAAQVNVPKHATPVIVTDSKGKQQYWTISIPPGLGFPLSSTEYANICSQAGQVARQVAGRRGGSKRLEGHDSSSHMQPDPNYIAVEEAQTRNLLPRDDTVSAVSAAATSNQHALSTTDRVLPICNRTLTYVLDATDAGLGSALLGLWLSYGLAAHENRTLFIDDTFFPYGNYSTFFIPPDTTATCRPPPPSQRVPCPHQARHLVVTGATTRWIFGDAFHQHYTQRQIFDMARLGYEALFKLRDDDAEYVRTRGEKMRSRRGGSSPSTLPSVTVNGRGYLEVTNKDGSNGLLGIHIRRGDRHPLEPAYRLSYLPPDRYMAAARRLVGQSEQWTLLLASDDPDMYDHPALADTVVRAQQRISLASKRKLGDGGLGWEGGFFKDVFWSLGLPAHVENERHAGSPAPTKKARPDAHQQQQQQTKEYDQRHSSFSRPVRDYNTNPIEEALKLRELLGRAYLLDLAMLAQSDKVVCGVSSNACRILAVMLGWERAFENKDWINVDDGDGGGGSGHDDYGWSVFDY